MPSLVDLLVEVHARKGFVIAREERVTGASGTPYAIPATATRDGERVLVFGSAHAPVSADDLGALARIVRDVGATRAVVAAPAQPDASSPDAAVEVWTRDVVAREIGGAVLESVLEDEAAAAVAPAAPAPSSSDIIDPEGPSRVPKRFPSLLSRAASAAMNPSETSYLYKTKPRANSAPDTEGKMLPYAWSAGGGAATSPTHRSVAEYVPNRPRAAAPRPAPAPAAASAGVAAQATATMAPVMAAEENDVELLTSSRKPAPAPASAPAPAAEVAPEGAHAAPENTVALKLDHAAAARAAGASGVRDARLVLEPHICFDYDANVTRPNLPTPLTGAGVVLAHAVTGDVREGPRFEATTHLPVPFDPPASAKVQAADVYEKVKGLVKKKFSREVKAVREVGETEVHETVRVRPELHELGIDHRGLVHLPVWVLETETGVVRVDGCTGEVIS